VLRGKIPRLKLALDGRVSDHHHFVLRRQVERLDNLEGDIAEVTAEIDRRLGPFEAQRALLTTIPGIERTQAATILAAIGTDMSVFHSADQLAAWAGVCPGNNETAGRRGKAKASKGNKALTTALVEAGHATGRKKGSHLRAKFRSIASRGGPGSRPWR
jgi:transposase